MGEEKQSHAVGWVLDLVNSGPDRLRKLKKELPKLQAIIHDNDTETLRIVLDSLSESEREELLTSSSDWECFTLAHHAARYADYNVMSCVTSTLMACSVMTVLRRRDNVWDYTPVQVSLLNEDYKVALHLISLLKKMAEPDYLEGRLIL